MAKLANLARMTTATTGTGAIALGAAVSGYLTFALAGIADGDTVSYGINDGNNSEVGTGVYTASGTTLTRNVTRSTNANAAINLSGTAQVFITPRAEDLPQLPVSVANGGTGDTGTAWTAYTPTMAGGGTWSASGSYKAIGKTYFISVALTLSNATGASGQFSFSLPNGITAAFPATALVRENGLAGVSYAGWVGPGQSVMTVGTFTNGAPTYASGAVFIASFVIQAT